MPELHGHLQFARPFGQVRPHGLRVVRCKMWRQLNEGGPEVVPQGQQPLNEIVGGAFAPLEAPEVGDDLRKLGTKLEPLRHRTRPFCHAFRRVDAVVCGVELEGAKLTSVMGRPGPLRVFFRVHGSAPGTDGPHRAAHPHFWRQGRGGRAHLGHGEASDVPRERPVHAFRGHVKFPKFHTLKVRLTRRRVPHQRA